MIVENLQALIDGTRGVYMTDLDRETQRRSFVYGNTHLDNNRITRKLIEQTADVFARRARA